MTIPAESQANKKYAKNSLLNLGGNILPTLVGLVCIPLLIRGLGTERFGVINIAWMLIGYFSLFDMGLGRALTQLVAEKIGKKEHDEIPGIFWTSTVIMMILGLLGALGIAALAPTLVRSVLKIPLPLQDETLYSFFILAVSIPFVILTAGFIGFISAYQRFDLIYAIRIPLGSFMFAGPLLVLPFSHSLVPVIVVLTVARAATLFFYLHCCFRILPDLKRRFLFQRSLVQPLLRFGGWMTVSNIISPIMVYFDRFFIGAIISLSAVAYYTTPFELVNRIMIIPLSLTAVLFPAFAESYVENKERSMQIYGCAVRYLFIILFPVILLMIGFAREGLQLWLGQEFAQHSYRVLQWLAMGIFINSLALIPCTFLQGIGRPNFATFLNIFELCLYIPLLWILTKKNGLEGAAMVWSLRVAVDGILLFYLAQRMCRPTRVFSPVNIVCLMAAIPILNVVRTVDDFNAKVLALSCALVVYAVVAWRHFLSADERHFLSRGLAPKTC